MSRWPNSVLCSLFMDTKALWIEGRTADEMHSPLKSIALYQVNVKKQQT